jgi:N6-L-threonylcarbamoyladenine synthase
MKILAIETSCDETAIAIIQAEGDETSACFRVLGNALLSQVELHREYGGVFPNLAKREHAKNLVPILEAALEEAELLHEDTQAISADTHGAISKLLEREPGLSEAFFAFVNECEPPAIDAIVVTAGPGLEPALWVGINFAKALALLWNKPLGAINHMEGHILSALAAQDGEALVIQDVKLPVLALLISGGHTELVLMKEWLTYELLGQTRDDAVGEAYDKVARMLSLPYPGGPEVSKLAEIARGENLPNPHTLPRPMIDTGTCDFSFAGLKTAVLYLLKNRPDFTEQDKKHIAHEFENAVADVLWKKTELALENSGAQTLVIGGGVSANTHIRRTFTENIKERSDVNLRIPAPALTTDNAIMIALAGFYHAQKGDFAVPESLKANGNARLA